KHDIVALRIYDKSESELPDMGYIKGFDPENGTERWIDTSSGKVRKAYRDWWLNSNKITDGILTKCGVDNVMIRTGEDYVKPLLNLFKRR
ncbi:MAG: DUF58 domain-containing protein, partial [Bacteroidales bacterium]|nr:DUF58 domain-containing protein [Bacteroidales bacterium]